MSKNPPTSASGQTQSHDQNNDLSLVGKWQGALSVGNGMELPLLFHLERAKEKYSGKMDSPMQGQLGIAFDDVRIDDLGKIEVSLGKAAYSGVFDPVKKVIVGTWRQAGASYPLDLSRVDKFQGPRRPQTPTAPFPYRTEAVTFNNASVSLSGTLTLPEGSGLFPALILIHGSGPLDRDETMFLHKPFLVLADYLTRRGIAVLRYDKRGFAKSTGDYKAATTEDFASDVEQAVGYLKTRSEIDQHKIGLLGHSEGGVIAPLVASHCKDVSFIVMMAASVLPGDQILMSQVRALGLAQGEKLDDLDRTLAIAKESYAIIKSEPDNNKAIEKIKAMRKRMQAPEYSAAKDQKSAMEGHVETSLIQMTGPWYRFFLSYDPRSALAKVQCPVLALNGDKDTQVIAQDNLDAIKTAVEKGGNKSAQEILLPGLNHLFQTSKSGLPSEYSSIDETISPNVLQIIADWIASR